MYRPQDIGHEVINDNTSSAILLEDILKMIHGN